MNSMRLFHHGYSSKKFQSHVRWIAGMGYAFALALFVLSAVLQEQARFLVVLALIVYFGTVYSLIIFDGVWVRFLGKSGNHAFEIFSVPRGKKGWEGKNGQMMLALLVVEAAIMIWSSIFWLALLGQ